MLSVGFAARVVTAAASLTCAGVCGAGDLRIVKLQLRLVVVVVGEGGVRVVSRAGQRGWTYSDTCRGSNIHG